MARLAARVGIAWVAGASVFGCTDPEPPEVARLEVVGVRADPPSGAPGRRIELELVHSQQVMPELAVDESRRSVASGIHVAWFGGCHNPPGGAYYGCFAALRAVAEKLPNPIPEQLDPDHAEEGVFGLGQTFAIQIPEDILIETSTGLAGVSFAFFAVCRGQLRPKPDAQNTVPLGCHDENGKELGNSRFAVGFTTIRTVPGVDNQNPEIAGVRLDGVPLERSTCFSDEDCMDLSNGQWPYRCGDEGECWPVIEDCDSPPCQDVDVELIIDPSSAEVLPAGEGSRPRETLHVEILSLLSGLGDKVEIYPGSGEFSVEDEFRLTPLPPDAYPEARQIPWIAMIEDERGGRGFLEWWFLRQ